MTRLRLVRELDSRAIEDSIAHADLPLRAAVRAKVGWQNARGIRATIIRLAARPCMRRDSRSTS